MAFQLSPGVLVTEKDLTSVVPSVATTAGGFAGAFAWGPAEQVITIDSENSLVERFGKPNDTNYASFFTAANFLSYGNNLQVVRTIPAAAKNSVSTGTAILIKNREHYDSTYADGSAAVGVFAAKYPGVLGDSIRVSMADSATYTTWQYKDLFDAAPNVSTYANQFGASRDEMHVIVIDKLGQWTGTAGTVLEKFPFVSKAIDAKAPNGSSIYYKNVLNDQSKYVWWMDHPATGSANWGTTVINSGAGTVYDVLVSNVSVDLNSGTTSDNPVDSNIIAGINLFNNAEKYDISLMPVGVANDAVAEAAIAMAESRKDCVVFLSPEQSDVVNASGSEVSNITSFRDGLPSSSYAVMDSGWKYQYDRYNDVYRWVPLNGDTAGLCVRTDFVADPWFSPSGFNRGQIKNVIKLAFSPSATDRDTLYKKGVNPVVTFPGQGTVLYGDKTLLTRPSAFDRINVRRLFIVLEKAIATAAKFQLFEFNDAFTRAQFRNLVEPFLRDVQGRRGITDFKVVCDETNNTGEVIDKNEFVADIYIKPARSINFIQLNFVATRSGISFEEVGA